MRVPWEDGEVQFPANLGLTWWGTLTRPGPFFRDVDWDGPFSRPLLYWLLLWIASAAVSLLWTPAEVTALSAALFGDGGVDVRLLQLLNFFLSPFVALLVLAFAVGFHHAVVLLLAPERRGADATGRVVCYSGGPLILTSLPVPWMIDWFVTIAVWAWVVTLLVIGFREAHRTSTARAGSIVAIPVLVAGFLAVMSILGLAAILASLPELSL